MGLTTKALVADPATVSLFLATPRLRTDPKKRDLCKFSTHRKELNLGTRCKKSSLAGPIQTPCDGEKGHGAKGFPWRLRVYRFRLKRRAFRRFFSLCLVIAFRRFLMTEPIVTP
jgi:hypothetical protein